MVNKKNIIIFALACMAGGLAFFFFYESDEAKIQKRFDVLATEAAKPPDEKELTAAIKAKKISEMCAESVLVEIPSYSISQTFSRSDISAHTLAARARYSRIAVKFYDVTIEITKEGIAEVSLTGSLEAKMTTGESVNEIHELRCRLAKIEKDWFFAKIEGVDVLEK